MKFNEGSGAAWADVKFIADNHPENPVGFARGELGDTLSTRAAISNYMAARRALGC